MDLLSSRTLPQDMRHFPWGKPSSEVNHFTFGFEGFQTHRHNYPCLSAGLTPGGQQPVRAAHKTQIGAKGLLEMLRQGAQEARNET